MTPHDAPIAYSVLCINSYKIWLCFKNEFQQIKYQQDVGNVLDVSGLWIFEWISPPLTFEWEISFEYDFQYPNYAHHIIWPRLWLYVPFMYTIKNTANINLVDTLYGFNSQLWSGHHT